MNELTATREQLLEEIGNIRRALRDVTKLQAPLQLQLVRYADASRHLNSAHVRILKRHALRCAEFNVLRAIVMMTGEEFVAAEIVDEPKVTAEEVERVLTLVQALAIRRGVSDKAFARPKRRP